MSGTEPSRQMVDLMHEFLAGEPDAPSDAPPQQPAGQAPPDADASARPTARRRRERPTLPPLTIDEVVAEGAAGDGPPAPPPADAAAPTEDAAPPAEAEDELTRLRRENQLLNEQIQKREWSSEGRYRKEKAARERLEAELAEATKRDQDANEEENKRWERVIAQATDAESKATLEAFYQTDRRAREAEAELAKIRRENERTTAINAALQQGERQRLEAEVREGAIPTVIEHLEQRAAEAGIAPATVKLLKAAIDTPDFRELAQTMPVELLGRTVYTRMGWIDQQIERLVEDQAQANREQAAQSGQFGRREAAPVGNLQPRNRAPERLRKTEHLAAALDELLVG